MSRTARKSFPPRVDLRNTVPVGQFAFEPMRSVSVVHAWTGIAFMAMVVTLVACGEAGENACDSQPTAECPARPDDETGYAQLVCQYAVEHGYGYPDTAA